MKEVKKSGIAETRAATQIYFSDCFYITFSRDSDSDVLNYGTARGKTKPGLKV